MKKTLRSLALAALALPLVASAQFTVETVWSNGVVDGTADPIPGLDGNWTKPVPGNPGTATCSRFAFGKDGKIFTTKHNTNSIITWDGKDFTTLANLPAVTTEKWNGTAITSDDAGNVIFNFCFTDATKSVTEWGVIDAAGAITEVTVPEADFTALATSGRLDIISHIVGDVNSAEGGIGYATCQKTNKVIMFHFKGDGSKVTSVSATASAEVEEIIDGNALIVPSAKYHTVGEILACANPENEFYAPFGSMNPTSATCVDQGLVAALSNGYFSPLQGFGNRQYLASAMFILDGKEYMVREYVNPAVMGEIFTTWKAVMTIGIFEVESGKCVAEWMGSEYSNAYGMATLSVEPVDENTVNVYTWVSTGSADNSTGTVPGCYAAMLKVSNGAGSGDVDIPVLAGEGTQDSPYQIGTAAELCAAYKYVNNAGGDFWFEQTADIDMADVTDWHAISGYNGVYAAVIHYDGKNHIIKNFKPNTETGNVAETDYYYCTSLFGVPSGEISNLGVVDAYCETTQGAGILGAYAGHSTSTALILDNVFVTGTVIGTGGYTGGMFGTTGNEVTMTDCFVNAQVSGTKFPAGLIGRASNDINLERVYVAGTVEGPDAYLVMGTNKAPVYNGYQVIAFNSGADAALADDIEVADEDVTVAAPTDEDAIAEVKSWSGFSDTVTVLGLPALSWYDASGITAVTIDDENAPVEYFNLQGMRVNQPAAGSIVIKKQGSKTSKFIVR